MKKNRLFEILLAITGMALGTATVASLATKEIATTRLCFTGSARNCYEAAIASTPETRERGLQGVTRLDGGSGMVFLFPVESPVEFWMARTLIPLRAVWIDSDGTVTGTVAMAPCPEKDPYKEATSCERYPSGDPARYVLEIAESAPAPKTGDRLRWFDLVELVFHGTQ